MHFVRYSFLLLSMVFVSTVWGQELSKLDGVLSWRSSAADFYFEKPIKSWKDFRDEGIVKQNLDYSCGAASVATVLNSFYGKNVTEAQLLKAMNKEDARASFEDMARVVQHWGFKAQGFASSWEQLQQFMCAIAVWIIFLCFMELMGKRCGWPIPRRGIALIAVSSFWLCGKHGNRLGMV